MRKTTGFSIKAPWRRTRIALALALLAGGLHCAWTQAQNAPPASAAPALPAVAPSAPATASAPHPGTPAKSVAGKPVTKKPLESRLAWVNLSAAQQQALEPLAGEWPKMHDPQKEKWLVISKKYAQMKPEEQQRLHERMRDWVKLTPAERSAARTNYARAKKLDAEEKNEQWNKYQQLSAEQKKKLAQAKLPKRVAKLPSAPGSAAPAIQLPAEALERTTPVPAPAIAPGSQAAPQAGTIPVAASAPAAPAQAATQPVASTTPAAAPAVIEAAK